MLKETPRSLRQYFGLIGGLSLLMALRNLATGASAPLFVAEAWLNLVAGVVFIYVAIRMHALLVRPAFIRVVLAICGVWSSLSFGWSLYSGLTLRSALSFVVSVLIVVYLMRSVGRLSREAAQKNAVI